MYYSPVMIEILEELINCGYTMRTLERELKYVSISGLDGRFGGTPVMVWEDNEFLLWRRDEVAVGSKVCSINEAIELINMAMRYEEL